MVSSFSRIDVLAGTQLEPHAARLDFGLFVVHDAASLQVVQEWEAQCAAMFTNITAQHGKNSVAVKSKAPGGRPWGGPLF